MRVFTAVELPVFLRPHCIELQRALTPQEGGISWTSPEHLHLTLHFFGESTPEQVHRIAGLLDTIAREQPPVAITLAGVGAFPSKARPRIVWIGVTAGERELGLIAGRIAGMRGPFGYVPAQEPFVAHLTIGRLNVPQVRDELAGRLARALTPEMSYTVTELVLYRSTLTPSGPCYTPLHKAPLRCLSQ